jgi:hypothetical protein
VSAAGASAPVKGAAPAIYRRHKELEGVRVELLGAWLVLARPGDRSSPWGVTTWSTRRFNNTLHSV